MALPPTPHYERCHHFVRQGDIGYFPFVQLLTTTEASSLPNGILPPTAKAVPVFEGMAEGETIIDGTSYLVRRWHGFGIVVDVTSELMQSPNDNRITVAPLVPRAAANANWDQVVHGVVAGVQALPAAMQGSIEPGSLLRIGRTSCLPHEV